MNQSTKKDIKAAAIAIVSVGAFILFFYLTWVSSLFDKIAFYAICGIIVSGVTLGIYFSIRENLD